VGPQYSSTASEKREPGGTINFTSADKPTLWLDIQDTLPASVGQKRVTMRCITAGWGVYLIEDNRGGMLFGN
jgi:hypothetical protein